ncbi:MAG: 50S ribosomal protein L25 [Bacteroidetes bacterium]|nr:MAG: 50S ribosomal protein L25 [Bacteroidota bacterium]
MREISLQAEVRNQVARGLFALRKQGKVPGVYYIAGEQNIPIAVNEKNLKPIVYTHDAQIVNLQLNTGVTKKCILRAVQYDPLTEKPIHFDLQGLHEDKKITLEIPIIVTGQIPQGVRDGGLLQHFIHKLKISCLPKDIPEHIELNATDLKINSFVHVSDLNLPNVTILENPTTALIGVVPPTVEKEAVAGTVAEEAVEPEVIAKGKKVEEEGAEGEKKAEGGAAKAPAAKAPAAETKK